MDKLLSYFDFTGENIDGNYIEGSWPEPMTQLGAEFRAKKILRECGGAIWTCGSQRQENLHSTLKFKKQGPWIASVEIIRTILNE